MLTDRRAAAAATRQVIYNEGWGQLLDGFPEFGLTDLVRSLDATRLVDATTGWFDHGAGDYSVRCLCLFLSHALCSLLPLSLANTAADADADARAVLAG